MNNKYLEKIAFTHLIGGYQGAKEGDKLGGTLIGGIVGGLPGGLIGASLAGHGLANSSVSNRTFGIGTVLGGLAGSYLGGLAGGKAYSMIKEDWDK